MNYSDKITERDELTKLIAKLVYSLFVSPLIFLLVWNLVAVDMLNIPPISYWQAFLVIVAIRTTIR